MASLKDLIVMGPARFLDKLYGNLEGNATTATKLQTARTLTLGNYSINFDGSQNQTFNLTVSNAWVGGTSAGPTLSTTVNGTTGAAVAIPSASSSASGIVTVGDQNFRGMKTFYGAVRGYMYNLNNNAPAFVFDKPSSHWTGIGACGENDTIFFGPCVPDGNVAGGYSWVANYNQKWKFQGDIYTTNLINATGTITSASTITGNRFVISSNVGQNHIEFSRGDWNYFIAPASGKFAFVANGLGAAYANAHVLIDESGISPGQRNGTMDLGTSSYRWKNVYGNWLHLSGAASATMTYASTNPSITFSENGSQCVKILYTDYDSYRAPAGLKVIGDAAGVWFEVDGALYTGGLISATGTITSASTITGNRFVISNSSSAAAHIEFSRVGWNYIIGPSGSSIAISPTGSTGDSNARLVIESTAVYPGANNGTVDLGKSNYKWNNVYGNNFSGNAASASWLNTNGALVYGSSGLQYFNLSGTAGTDPKTNNTPTSDWHHILRMNHANNNGYFADIAVPLNNTNGIYWRQIRNGTNYGWYTLLDSNNYTSYTVKKDGTGASGTWGISISGNAATATKATQDGSGNTITSTYLKLSGGTMNAGSQIIRAGQSKSWISGRDGALLRINTLSGYSPAISIKTNNGTWEIGAYDNSNYTDKLIFSFATDANYSANNNSTTQWMITKDGYFNGSCASANSVAWGNVSGKPSTFAPSSHTHSYLPLSGGSVTGAISITTNGVTNSFYSQNSSFTHYSTSASTGHWFNKAVYVAGEIYAGTSYNQRVYHMGNIVYGSEPTNPVDRMIWLYPA